METSTTPLTRRPEVIAPGDGSHFHFLNHLATVKVRAGGDGSMSVVEFTAPRGFAPPLHRHHAEDELIYVLEGEVAFHLGEELTVGTAGAAAYLPHAIPHTFQVRSDEARFLAVTASRTVAPRFDALVSALGTPTDATTLPEPAYIDPTHVADVCLEHGIDVLGPPPAPLA